MLRSSRLRSTLLGRNGQYSCIRRNARSSEREFSGPARIVGSAGTGKTVVALHRASHHLRRSPDGRVLLATFSEPLANALRGKLGLLAGADRHLLDRVAVTSFRGIAEELHQLAFAKKAHLASREIIRSLVEKAREAAGIDDVSSQFMLSEWFNVVDAWQVPTSTSTHNVPPVWDVGLVSAHGSANDCRPCTKGCDDRCTSAE